LLDELGLARRTGFRAWALREGVDVAALLGLAAAGARPAASAADAGIDEAGGGEASGDEERYRNTFEDLWLQLTSQAETRPERRSPQERTSPQRHTSPQMHTSPQRHASPVETRSERVWRG